MLGVKVLYRSDGPGADQISTWEQGVSWNLWQHHDTCRLEPRFFCFVCLFVFLLWRGRRPKTHGSTGLPFSDSVWGGGRSVRPNYSVMALGVQDRVLFFMQRRTHTCCSHAFLALMCFSGDRSGWARCCSIITLGV